MDWGENTDESDQAMALAGYAASEAADAPVASRVLTQVVQTPARVNVICATPLGEETASSHASSALLALPSAPPRASS